MRSRGPRRPAALDYAARGTLTLGKAFGMLYVDIETYCDVSVTDVGTYRYAADPSMLPILIGYAEDDGPVRVTDSLDEVRGLLTSPGPKCAHNSDFDRLCLSAALGVSLDWAEWTDTAALAAAAGYPRSLEGVASALGAGHKNAEGKRLVKKFCQPGRWGRVMPEDAPEDWQLFADYCGQDVTVLRGVHRRLPPLSAMERRVLAADHAVNERGLLLDMPLVATALEVAMDESAAAKEALEDALYIENGGSTAQIRQALLTDHGYDMLSLDKKSIQAALDDPAAPEQVKAALRLRQAASSTTWGKYRAMQARATGDRLRGAYRYFGAHTGRWSSGGAQLQNLSREGTTEQREAIIADLRLGLGASLEGLKLLVRGTIIGDPGLVVYDFAQIEARTLAWLAGEQWVLDVARDESRDYYTETGRRMGGMDRGQGKVAALALGYGGGTGAMRNFGYGGPYRDVRGRPCEKIVHSPETTARLGKSEAELQVLVHAWRAACPRIAHYWSEVEEVFWVGGSVGAVTVHPEGDTRHVVLPSGRALSYRQVRQSGRGLRYLKAERGVQVSTWGGSLTENITQAVARDVFAEALVRVHEAGYPVVGHSHDELIVEGPQEWLDPIGALMRTPPAWAWGLPIGVKGEWTRRYTK